MAIIYAWIDTLTGNRNCVNFYAFPKYLLHILHRRVSRGLPSLAPCTFLYQLSGLSFQNIKQYEKGPKY